MSKLSLLCVFTPAYTVYILGNKLLAPVLTGLCTKNSTAAQWKNPLLSIFHFRYWPKTLKDEVLKPNPQIILGFFDPDPVLLAKQAGGVKD